MGRLKDNESVLSSIDNAINQINDIATAASNQDYTYFSDEQPLYGVDEETQTEMETIEHMRDFEPKIMFDANFLYANDDFNYGTVRQGISQEYYMSYDRDTLLTWMARYNGINLGLDDPAMDFNFGAYFTVRHYLQDWNTDPEFDTSEMAQKLDIVGVKVGDNFSSGESSYATTPDDIDISHLLLWFDRYASIGIYPEVAAQLVIRHLRGDWAEWPDAETNGLIQDLIERSQQRDGMGGSSESATGSTIFSVTDLFGTSSDSQSDSGDLVYWNFD